MQRQDLLVEEKAGDFLRALDPNSRVFGNAYALEPEAYCFRGQANADWPLIARALRHEAGRPVVFKGEILSELNALWNFFRASDRVGLPLPEDSQDLRSSFSACFGRVRSGNEFEWPPKKLWSFIGLAQHYGVPTRFLDWTLSSLAAAYFAAKEASGWLKYGLPKAEKPFPTHLAVWGLFTELYDRNESRVDPALDPDDQAVEVVTAPRATNPNLQAQKGLFTLVRTKGTKQDDKTWQNLPLDKVADLTGIALPISEAPQLLYMLARLGVSAATLFPGYAGVVESLRETDLHGMGDRAEEAGQLRDELELEAAQSKQ
jgi:hypothetical protein